MSARTKLNSASVAGALLIAGLVGIFVESWTVFLIVGAVLVGLAIHSGDIRVSPGPRR